VKNVGRYTVDVGDCRESVSRCLFFRSLIANDVLLITMWCDGVCGFVVLEWPWSHGGSPLDARNLWQVRPRKCPTAVLFSLLRCILVLYLQADYDDNRHNEPPAGLEANLGRLPVASIGGNTVGQSGAINFFIASELGLMGDSTFEAAQILSIYEHVKEMRTKYSELVPWGTEPSVEKLNDWFDGGTVLTLSF
jgi:hypothetical protein